MELANTIHIMQAEKLIKTDKKKIKKADAEFQKAKEIIDEKRETGLTVKELERLKSKLQHRLQQVDRLLDAAWDYLNYE
jgi:predicted nucleic acid-binding Zn finger protein